MPERHAREINFRLQTRSHPCAIRVNVGASNTVDLIDTEECAAISGLKSACAKPKSACAKLKNAWTGIEKGVRQDEITRKKSGKQLPLRLKLKLFGDDANAIFRNRASSRRWHL